MTEKDDDIINESSNEISIIFNSELQKKGDEITNQIINENDSDKLEDLTNLFNLNQRKREIARQNKLSNLLDDIDREVVNRFTNAPELFDDEVLLKYMTSTQQAINNLSQNKTPLIQINNQRNEININQSGLNRESRAKVLEAVQSILNESNVDVIDAEVKK